MKPDVPEDETKIVKAADMPVKKVGDPTTTKPRSKSPTGGASAGRSLTPTATTRMKIAMKRETTPIHAGCQRVRLRGYVAARMECGMAVGMVQQVSYGCVADVANASRGCHGGEAVELEKGGWGSQ
jgi:hypothetical protein